MNRKENALENCNPFVDDRAVCCVLINDEQQYSLWPEALAVPDGWRIAFGPSVRTHCAEWLEKHWRDMRPHSLRLHDVTVAKQEAAGV